MRSSDDATFTERARREQIVAAAMRVIADGGYANASIAKIADHIGIAKSVVLYHFKTKDEIIAAVVMTVFGATAAQLGPAVAAAPAPPAVPSAPASVPPVVQAPTLRSVVTQSRPAPPPPPPPPPVMGVRGRGNVMATLPEPARALADAFAKDQQAYIEEMTQKVTARRATFTAEMQRLQDELAKAGNLDDAVAIRDYLRRAAPSGDLRPTVRGGRGGMATPVTGRGRAGGGR